MRIERTYYSDGVSLGLDLQTRDLNTHSRLTQLSARSIADINEALTNVMVIISDIIAENSRSKTA